MCYRLLIKSGKSWQELGLQHATVESARDEARGQWAGLPYLILPV
jgi:hypothetical protein